MRWGIALLALTGTAAADPAVRDDDKLEADKLFQQGRELLTAGKRAEACAKFDLSIRKDPRAVGTILNLGLCAEEAGQVATAVRYYTEARARAKDQELAEHQQAAESKLALLAPRVPHVAITLPAGAPADTRVIVDSQVLASDQLADVPVDPGEHAITVTAHDKLPYETKVTVQEAEHKSVAVPALQGARTVVVRASSRKLYGKLTIAGGAVLGIGALGLGWYARKHYWDQFPAASQDGMDAYDLTHDCFTYDGGKRGCNQRGLATLHTARELGWVATGTGIAAVLTIAAGAYLVYTAPGAVTVDVNADHAAVAVTGRW